MIWRLGSQLPRVLFLNGVYVGTIAHPELAAEIVNRMNASEPGEVGRLRAEVARLQNLLREKENTG